MLPLQTTSELADVTISSSGGGRPAPTEMQTRTGGHALSPQPSESTRVVLIAERFMLEKIRQLSPESKQELEEFIEDLLDKDEDRRDMLARQRHIEVLRARHDAEV
jgi:hypothetical protein